MASAPPTVLARAGRAVAAAFAAALAVVAVLGSLARLDAGPYDLPTVGGVGTVFVTSGSMEPDVPTGSLAVVRRQGAYREGDVVTYVSPSENALVTHRIVRFDEYGRVIARGDANNVDDPAFDPSLIEGKVVACAPYAGLLAQAVQTPQGASAVLLAAAAWLLLGLSRRPRPGEPAPCPGPAPLSGETMRSEA